MREAQKAEPAKPSALLLAGAFWVGILPLFVCPVSPVLNLDVSVCFLVLCSGLLEASWLGCPCPCDQLL